jgi:hypothetical protein
MLRPKWDKLSEQSTHDIIVNVRHTWLEECTVRAMRRNLKLISEDGDSGNEKWKRNYGEACGRV